MAILGGVPHVIPHRVHINGNATDQIQLRVRGVSGQSANIFEVQNSAGTTLFSVDNSGNVSLTGNITAVINETLTGNIAITGTLSVTSTSSFVGAVTTGVLLVGSTLTVTGLSTFNQLATFNQGINVAGTTNLNGQVNFNGSVAFSGAVGFGDGTAALPSITFASDTDTGIYRAAANQLGFAVNGAVEMTLNATALAPGADGGSSLGTTTTGWQNLFGNTGFVFNLENGDWVATHTAGILTVGTGDLRVTTAGTNTASVVTVGGTQTLTSKTLTSPTIGTSPTAAGATWTDLGTVTTADINGGTLDGVTIGGAATAAASVTTLTTSGIISVDDTTDSSSTTTGSIHTDGGLGVVKKSFFGDHINLASAKNITVNGANPFRTIVLTAAGGTPATTAGCAAATKVEAGTNDIDYFVLDFDAASDEYAFWNVVMPDNYDGSTITAQFIWTNAGGQATETVSWNISGRAYADDAAIDQATGTAVAVTDTWIAQGDVHISATSGAITLAGSPAGGQYVQFKVYRDVSEDTLTGDARLLAIKLEYGINAYSN